MGTLDESDNIFQFMHEPEAGCILNWGFWLIGFNKTASYKTEKWPHLLRPKVFADKVCFLRVGDLLVQRCLAPHNARILRVDRVQTVLSYLRSRPLSRAISRLHRMGLIGVLLPRLV